jgi:hypothetical protein
MLGFEFPNLRNIYIWFRRNFMAPLSRTRAQVVNHWFPQQRPRFDLRSYHMGFMVNKVVLGQLLSEYFDMPWRFSFSLTAPHSVIIPSTNAIYIYIYIYIYISIVGVESSWVRSALRPPMAYCASPGWLWWWRNWWNDWQGKPKYSKKTCPSATLSTTNPICCLDANPWPPRWEASV